MENEGGSSGREGRREVRRLRGERGERAGMNVRRSGQGQEGGGGVEAGKRRVAGGEIGSERGEETVRRRGRERREGEDEEREKERRTLGLLQQHILLHQHTLLHQRIVFHQHILLNKHIRPHPTKVTSRAESASQRRYFDFLDRLHHTKTYLFKIQHYTRQIMSDERFCC